MDRASEMGDQMVAQADDIARRITVLWSGLSSDEPWLSRYANLTQDHLPEMVRALATAALVHPASREAGKALVRAAREHGASRRDEGHPDVTIPGEYLLLRRALRPIIAELAREPALLTSVVAHIELGIGLAEAAALHGYHGDNAGARPPDDDDAPFLATWADFARLIA
jgi:hypothetical protein